MPPQDVPDTFFISAAVPDGKGGLNGGEAVTVTIADIIAANGLSCLQPKRRSTGSNLNSTCYTRMADRRTQPNWSRPAGSNPQLSSTSRLPPMDV